MIRDQTKLNDAFSNSKKDKMEMGWILRQNKRQMMDKKSQQNGNLSPEKKTWHTSRAEIVKPHGINSLAKAYAEEKHSAQFGRGLHPAMG